jgi:tetratricopeptide (TPR) repeat protein
MARHREAENLYREALNIRQIAQGSQHPDVATIFNNLGVLRAEQGRYQDAEQMYRRAVAVLENVTAGSNPSLATTLSNLVQIQIIEGRYASAQQLNLAALSEWERSVGSDHPSLLRCLVDQGLILRKMKRTSEAGAFEKRASTIRAKYGSDASSYSIDVSLLQATGKKRKQIKTNSGRQVRYTRFVAWCL